MDRTDLTEYEFENDIQRFMQIREQVHEEIKKIGLQVTTLDQTNKRLVAHFDVFKKLSTEAEEHLKSVIKEAALDMARDSAKRFSQLIEDSLKDRLSELDRSVQYAQRALHEKRGSKYRKLALFSFLSSLILSMAGFGGGYYYAKKNTYALPEDFIKMYARGLLAHEADLEKKTPRKPMKKK